MRTIFIIFGGRLDQVVVLPGPTVTMLKSILNSCRKTIRVLSLRHEAKRSKLNKRNKLKTMDPFAVRKNLEAILLAYESRCKIETNEITLEMHKVKIEALKQAIQDQKDIKYFGGMKNLLSLAEKGAEPLDLFKQPQG